MSSSPNVIVIGASKCGTTSLHEYFSKHPEVFVSSKKELHYHTAPELNKYINGPGDKFIVKQICQTKASYLNYYNSTEKYKARIDVSPSYLFFPAAINSIKEVCGSNTAIICMVRHPVDKMVSQYSHLLSAGRETLSFEEALAKETDRKKEQYGDMWLYMESAFMSEKIKAYKQSFEKVLVIHARDLHTHPTATMQLVFKFVGVHEMDVSKFETVAKNFSGIPKSKLVSRLFIQPNAFTNTLRQIVPQKTGKMMREWINSKNKGQKYQANPALEQQLEQSLQGEIEDLNYLINSGTAIIRKY